MAILNTQPVSYQDRAVKIPKRSFLKRTRYALMRRKQLVEHNREQRRLLHESLENLTDPTFLQRVEEDQRVYGK